MCLSKIYTPTELGGYIGYLWQEQPSRCSLCSLFRVQLLYHCHGWFPYGWSEIRGKKTLLSWTISAFLAKNREEALADSEILLQKENVGTHSQFSHPGLLCVRRCVYYPSLWPRGAFYHRVSIIPIFGHRGFCTSILWKSYLVIKLIQWWNLSVILW